MAVTKYVCKSPYTVNLITPLKMPSFKYQVNDRVKERQSNRIHGNYINTKGTHKFIKTRKGVVKGVNLKKNSAGANVAHYQVLWDNQSRCIEIQAHRIEHEVK